ncbi:unnamed protein product [Polarella glacialis]|uniref:Thioesterase domain-containing protein n=1 Tax=Polarella glacialis TaxID=89957 RepID=A0A813HVD4_POLGL|nr:unnamed protein product [Polarella glacialis]
MGEELPYAESLQQLVQDILQGLGREVLSAKPFVIFGHSFGSWVAYEIVQELARRASDGWPQPLKLYVSGYRPPQLCGSRHDPDRIQPALGALYEDEFWEHFERRYGRNPDLQVDYIRSFVVRTLQADFTLLEAYVPSSLEPLAVPLCACCARGDSRARPGQLSAWAKAEIIMV